MRNSSHAYAAALAVAFIAAGPLLDSRVQAQMEAPGAMVASETAIPPSDQTASAALADSPRHGEYVDIEFTPASSAAEFGGAAPTPIKIKTFVAYPESSEKAAVVLVIHEIFGLTDWIRSVADELAAHGFIAIAPDLLSGLGPDGGGTEALGDKVRDTIRTLTPDQVAERLNAVRDYALKLPSASDKTAAVGFCWGGTAAFNYAVRQPALNASVVYYGTAPMSDGQGDVDAMKKIVCPVLGLYGGDDARVTSTVEPTVKAMTEAGKAFTQYTYDDAGHGFLRQSGADQRNGANLKAAQQAWKSTLEFLREHTK